MPYPTKIATCCHCGTKAALRLDKGRHELSCTSCGAPLHDLKMLPVKQPAKPGITHQKPSARRSVQARHTGPAQTKERPKPKKRRSGWFGKRLKDFAEDVFDAVEDIFD